MTKYCRGSYCHTVLSPHAMVLPYLLTAAWSLSSVVQCEVNGVKSVSESQLPSGEQSKQLKAFYQLRFAKLLHQPFRCLATIDDKDMSVQHHLARELTEVGESGCILYSPIK